MAATVLVTCDRIASVQRRIGLEIGIAAPAHHTTRIPKERKAPAETELDERSGPAPGAEARASRESLLPRG